MNNITVLLPAYNEEVSIGKVIDEVKALPIGADILVVDGSSTDATYTIASCRGVKAHTVKPIGKGYAVQKGLKYIKTPYVVMINSDWTYPASFISDLVGYLEDGYDVVIGYRAWKEYGAMSKSHALGNRFLSKLASMLYGYPIKDVCSGMWAFKRDALERFHLRSKGFTLESDLYINSVKSGCKIMQTPIMYRRRLEDSDAKLRLSDAFKITWFLVKRRFKW